MSGNLKFAVRSRMRFILEAYGKPKFAGHFVARINPSVYNPPTLVAGFGSHRSS